MSSSSTTQGTESLHLRVMRLTHPLREFSPHPYFQHALDEVFEKAFQHNCSDLLTNDTAASCSVSDPSATHTTTDYSNLSCTPIDIPLLMERTSSLVLPVIQGNQFAGETFRALVNLVNSGSTTVVRIGLQIELLQSSESRFSLFDNSREPLKVLGPQDTFNCTVVQQLVDPGTYTLVCVVTYHVTQFSPQRALKRVYKFPVTTPFKLSHHICYADERLFLQCTFNNTSGQGIFLKNAAVLCADGVDGVRLDNNEQTSERSFKGLYHFKANDTYSILFMLTASDTLNSPNDFLKKLSYLGSLKIEWHTPAGGYGCYSGYKIEVSSKRKSKSIELSVTSYPQSVKVQSLFNIEFQVSNNLDRIVEPLIIFDCQKMNPLFTQGVETQAIGALEPKKSKRVEFPLIATLPGLYTLQGISVHDPHSRQTYEFSDLCDILAF